jgi:hypothetical protein
VERDEPSKMTPKDPSPILRPTRKCTPITLEPDEEDEWEVWCWEVAILAGGEQRGRRWLDGRVEVE